MRAAVILSLGLLFAPAITAADPEASPALGHICGAPAPDAPKAAAARQILDGYGSGGFTVRTASPAAQAYFNNGMQLGHAFAHKASIAAFQEAEKLDPACAMCAWGEAWARGPTINYPIDAKEQAALAALADKAAGLSQGGPDKERRLISALQHRYRNGGGKGPGDYAFARDMDRLARDYPQDNEIAIVAADAWMIPSAHKESRENLGRALELIGGALTRKADDTGAIHFYIHATEMEGIGGQAERYADTLQRLAPAASHLVHMPSHTYYIVGRYEDAVRANMDATRIDAANAQRQGLSDPWKLVYHTHNVQFATGAAVRREAALVQASAADLKAFEGYVPQAVGMIDVARLVLTGRAAMIEGKPALAAAAFRTAAQIQDAKLGRISDPPGWWYPVRRSLAAALLDAGKPDEAATQARLTLKTWPNDPVTLAVLAQAERKLGDGKAADLHLAQARRGWHGEPKLAALASLAGA
jgi:tetratricopeptide (TPR) repeat protein